ncbi:MAG: tyrosine-type recombinase/integrase [Lacibacter sp.]
MPSSKKVITSFGSHEGQGVIWFSFEYNTNLQKRLKKKFPDARWSQSQKKWWIKDTKHNRDLLGMPAPSVFDKSVHRIHPVNSPALKRFIETLQLKAYSASTINTYTNEFCALLSVLKNHPVDTLRPERLRAYILYCINELKLSENLVHSRLNAVKFYFEQVLHRDRFFTEIPRPKKKSSLPKVLSTSEIKRLLAASENTKHLLMLQLCYGMGLRVSEVVNLKISDIDSKRMQVFIEAAKGKKDRYVNLPQTLLPLLRAYYKEFKPKKYLVEGVNGGQYAIRSVQAVFKNAMRKAKINKPVGIHSLRHSYATHLMEYGTDVAFIQKLLGHNDIKTTLIYTHIADKDVTKIISPLDKLA